MKQLGGLQRNRRRAGTAQARDRSMNEAVNERAVRTCSGILMFVDAYLAMLRTQCLRLALAVASPGCCLFLRVGDTIRRLLDEVSRRSKKGIIIGDLPSQPRYPR